jgi:stress response protein YsnF
MATETVVAVFPLLTSAQAAIADLETHGIARNAISYYTKDTSAYVESERTPREHKGFWASLFGTDDTYDRDYAAYDTSVRTGNIVVTVITDSTNAEYVASLLETHNPIDLDTRTSAAPPTASPAVGSVPPVVAPPATTAPSQPESVNTEAVLPLHEEHLEVGKKVSQTGVTRVRRFVTERPVSEQIALRDERVTVHRRPAMGVPIAGALSDAFVEKVIEIVETAETPVVQKVIQQVEEVVIGKLVNERVATVEETVRKEHVDVTGGPNDAPAQSETFNEAHPNLAHPVETVEDKFRGWPTPAQRSGKD